MVKLKGPGLATQASGQLAHELIFSNWRGTAYLKQYRRPKQPQAPAQIAMRAILRFLSEEWSQISDVDRATWSALAAASNVSPFNAYQGHNLTRHRNGQRPTQTHPATETGLNPWVTSQAAIGGIRSIRFIGDCADLGDGWGELLFKVTAEGIQPVWDQLIHIMRLPPSGLYEWTRRNVPAGVHYFAFSQTTTSGKFIICNHWDTATVTD